MRLRTFSLVPILCAGLIAPAWADDKPAAPSAPTLANSEKAEKAEPLTKVPANVQELKDLQRRVQEVYKKVTPAVVGIQIGGASGSGVIVTDDGYVLTAGHVSGKPETECTIIFPDGKRVKAKSLGANKGIDSGMIKITESGKWPHVPLGESKDLKKGQWTIAIGHPGGFFPGRSPVLRLGRIQNATDSLIQTDCTLVGGDSGGPLFDLNGKVIGIHSRIGPSITFNIHVPISTYVETWDDLVAGKSWGDLSSGPSKLPAKSLDLGARYELIGGVLKVSEVKSGSLFDKAGIKAKDLIMKVDGHAVGSKDEIEKIIQKKKSGEQVVVEVDRNAERLSLKLTVKSNG